MQRTKIEWCDYVWNPVKGLCPNDCKLDDGLSYCYARSFYKRFKWNPEIRFDCKEMDLIDLPSKPSRIFVGSTIDLFHPSFTITDISLIIRAIRMRSGADKHIWMFLTKNSERYAQFYFPKNCWLGVTVTNYDDLGKALSLKEKDNLRFVSFEPLLGDIKNTPRWLDWLIVGAMTGAHAKKYRPKWEWIERIVSEASEFGIPIFLKDNLKEIWQGELIQGFPDQT